MPRLLIPVVVLVVVTVVSCGSRAAATPAETFKTYVKASQKKDAAAMRLLLSDATITMHEKEAKAQGVKLDEIITRDSLIAEGQRTVEYRNEKVEGDKATLEYKTFYGSWDKIVFVREDGVWKLDKQAIFDQMLQDSEEANRKLDEQINSGSPLY